jgi:dipeptidyl aminopeptidase/acylaminoacyl peptidase
MSEHAVVGDVRGDPAHHLDYMRARIIMRGTDFSDYERVRDQVHDWESWWSAWSGVAEQHLASAERHRANGWTLSEGDARIRAGLAYHWAKSLAVEDDEEYRAISLKSVEAVADGYRLIDPTFERIEVPFDGGQVIGNLRRPSGVDRPPLIVLVPGLESVKEEFPTWEEHFLSRGMATISIDGPGQGESGFDLRIRYDYEAPFSALLDALEGRDDLDLSRIGTAGISLGGYYVVRAAAFEPRIKALLSNCGAWNLAAAFDGMHSIYQTKVTWNLGTDEPAEVRELTSKISLDGVAQQVSQPTLVVYGAADALVSASHGTSLSDALPNSELWMIEGGNHGVTNYPQTHLGPGADWLCQQLA